MTSEEIKARIIEYGLDKVEDQRALLIFAEEIERETRYEFFRLIQIVNNAASGQEVTSRELDSLLFHHRKANR